MNEVKKRKNTINLLIVSALVVFSVTPMFGVIIPMIVKMALILVWVISALNRKYRSISAKPIVIFPFLLLLLIFFYKIAGISSAEWGNYANQLFFYTAIWMMMFINDEYSDKEKKTLGYVCFITVLINLISNVVMYYTLDRYTAWSYIGASKIEEYVRRFNLGSTSFVTMICLYSGISFVLFGCSKGKAKLIYFASCIISLFYLIVCSGRATILILGLLMYLLFFLYRNARASNLVPIVIVLIALILFLFRFQIIGLITQLLPNERMAVRISAIGEFLSGRSDGGDYLDRIEIIALDFSTWLKSFRSFLFGIGDHRYLAGNLSQIYTIGISGHSDYFDFLAQYGIVGFTLLNVLFLNLYNYFRREQETTDRWLRLTTIIFVIFILRSVVGSIFSMDIATLMFIFIPVAYYLTDERERSSEYA